MTLAQALTPAATPASRARGAAYFTAKAVTAFLEQDGGVNAVVHGSDNYEVRLEPDTGVIRGSCTCPYFVDRLELCKHLWAVVLECDARRVTLLPEHTRPRDIDFEPVLPEDEGHAPPPSLSPVIRRAKVLEPAQPRRTRTTQPAWRQMLNAVASGAARSEAPRWALPGQLLYVIDLGASRTARAIVIHLMTQDRMRNGDWTTPKTARLSMQSIGGLEPDDRNLLERLTGAKPASLSSWGLSGAFPSPFELRGASALDLLPLACRTGRVRLALTSAPAQRPEDAGMTSLAWDAGPPWRSVVDVRRDEAEQAYVMTGVLERDSGTMPLYEVLLLLDDGLVITRTSVARLDHGGALPWMTELMARERVTVPFDQRDTLRDTFLALQPPTRDLPEDLRIEIRDAAPRPCLTVRRFVRDRMRLAAEVAFNYDGTLVAAAAPTSLVRTSDGNVVLRRDRAAERAANDRLYELGIRSGWNPDGGIAILQLFAGQLPRIVRELVRANWHVEAEGQVYRLPSTGLAINVSSGLDWFEVRGKASFGDQDVSLPALLAALQRGDRSIVLDDGSVGMIPEEWLEHYTALALGTPSADHVRFRLSQVLLLDALLAARPLISWDDTFARARDRLRAFDGIPPLDPPATFAGTLRGYQREGLGWLTFLRELGFGACLADDMGLGKTVMILALLEARRHERAASGAGRRPSLVVAPRSVVYNWQQEAARFTPGLRVLDFSGATRAEQRDQIAESDLVITTYGTLRRDAERLANQDFDYVILDEAQTIKNAATVSAKAARLLKGAHRIALSGTPIENRLSDLWSLFEFLNPGLLSGASAFAGSFSKRDADAEGLRILGQGLRPFILRRTKEQVAAELPPKTEQTIECELDRPQRALYNELRDHYRRRLLSSSATWERSKLQVLEALLRLRQAACHPGLIDPKRSADKSAKLDLLVPRLIETIEEGHKTLVFSQFTSFLGLLRRQLDERHLTYEYLDGKTRDRAARIDRFQSDPDCRLFLISLKAGGLGLNLTAADYVFLLDPWWNPAAEAQAIDRTHRIGQTRSVFAYRLIARDTVEERVLELQQRKRTLADAILTEDNSIVRNLRREDLELLLS